MSKMRLLALLTAAAVCQWAVAKARTGRDSIVHVTSSQAVFIDPLQFAVLGSNATFRQSSFTEFFNPTNTTPPFFQIFDNDFTNILGATPAIYEVASNATFAFAHEAPIYDSDLDAIFFASNDGGPLGMSDLNHNNQYSMLSLKDAEAQIANLSNGSFTVNVPITKLNLSDSVQMTNGGTGPFNGNLILINSGRGALPPNIVFVNPRAPHNVTVLLDNFYGRQFNSLNDIKVHPTSGKFFFTDVVYGFLNHFRPAPLMPSQVYMFDPSTGRARVVADGFDKPNGIAFTADGKTAYVTDTGSSGGFLGNNQTEPASIYAFDVDPSSQLFTNRRVFTYVDNGVPDGIQLDTNGNVYSGCGDGAQVWNSDGILLGKFFLGTTSANLVFAGPGRLVILAETKVFVAHIAANGFSLGGPSK